MKQRILLFVLGIIAVFGIFALLLSSQATASRKLGGEVGQCLYLDECRYENEGFGVFVGYNYQVCTGAWSGYGRGWVRDDRCVYPAEEPRKRV